MNNQIKEIIKEEVRKHEKSLQEIHVETIADAIYKQLSEYLDEKQLNSLVEIMRPDFEKIVDILIPIVEEYENKIDDVLNNKVGTLIAKL